MTQLIIGRTDHRSTRIWVRGGKHFDVARVSVTPEIDAARSGASNSCASQTIFTSSSTDYTGIAEFNDLCSSTQYRVLAEFATSESKLDSGKKRKEVRGLFSTGPEPSGSEYREFAFVLGSCNLSIVSIYNLLALLLQILGFHAGARSLNRKVSTWYYPPYPWVWLRPLLRRPCQYLIIKSLAFVQKATEGKQSGEPMLRSPFFKLSATFDCWSVEIQVPEDDMCFIDEDGKKKALELYPGTRVSVRGIGDLDDSASGVVAFQPRRCNRRSNCHSNGPRRLLLTKITGTFKEGDEILVHRRTSKERDKKYVDRRTPTILLPFFVVLGWTTKILSGLLLVLRRTIKVGDKLLVGRSFAQILLPFLVVLRWTVKTLSGVLRLLRGITKKRETILVRPRPTNITAAGAEKPWSRPAFMIHAGDQIYYDFPNPKRKPSSREYRRSYREAWYEDPWARHFLAHIPNFMTLDDHEIVNNFSVDFQLSRNKRTPLKKSPSATEYKEAALEAYREYVHSRHVNEWKRGHLFYDFEYAGVKFFMLDTRTQRRIGRHSKYDEENEDRRIGKQQMLDPVQKNALLEWFSKNSKTLKFVVSSVPFVAEVTKRQETIERVDRMYRSDDKWSGTPFERQRDEILEAIFRESVENVIFLVGDMHCSYHAAMEIGNGKKYERIVVHELAGGPINQLQLARREQFVPKFKGRTSSEGLEYRVELDRFHTGTNSVMHIALGTERSGDALSVDSAPTLPTVHWSVIRTMTRPKRDRHQAQTALRLPEASAMCGQITLRSMRGV